MHQFAMHFILAIHLLTLQKLVSQILNNSILICGKGKVKGNIKMESYRIKKIQIWWSDHEPRKNVMIVVLHELHWWV